jgi:glycosyltransferase involved in cell wall biosynthesis
MPLVSIIIACLNDLKHLPKAVDSVLDQSFTDIELIIMDGASKDGTPDYLKTLSDPRVTWRSERDDGLTQAWNKAVGLAQGNWLLFLGADDYIWDRDVIARAAPYLKDSNANLAFGNVNIVAEHSDDVVQTADFDRDMLLAQLRGPKGLGLPHQGFFHNGRAFDTGLFDASFRLAADYEFISRYSATSDFLFLPIGPVAAFRMGGLTTNPWVSLEAYSEWKRIYHMRGRPRFHGWWQLSKALAKAWLRGLLGAGFARRLVNLSRLARGLPPYPG